MLNTVNLFIALVVAAITYGTPLLFGTLGEVLTEKSGSLNLGVEGIMFMGGAIGLGGVFYYEKAVESPSAFLAVLIGLLCAFIAGGIASLIFSFLTITLRANQNVTGLALTIFGTGVGQYIGEIMRIREGGFVAVGNDLKAVFISSPFPQAMQDIPYVGKILFGNSIFFYLGVVLAIVMGLSVFFKVETITVTGADTYSAWAVREASGISEGDKLLTFSKIRAASQIMANLPYVKGVRIGIKLPDTVNIMIEEESVVYAIKSSDGQWWMMDSDGRVVEQANNAKAATATRVLGVTLEAPTVNEKGVATEMTPSETNELGELIPVTTTGAQRLTAALQILKALENNDIVGEAASVDVTSTEDIILWYGTRYQVNLGDTSRLDYKVDCMNDAILQMSDYQSGVLDISFTIWPNQVGYTPFA